MNSSLNPAILFAVPLSFLKGTELVCFYRWLNLMLSGGDYSATSSDLAGVLKLPQTSIVRMLKALNDAGYVELIDDPINRRGGKKEVCLTGKLHHLMDSMDGVEAPVNAELAHRLLMAPYLTGKRKWDVCGKALSGAGLTALCALIMVAGSQGLVRGFRFSDLQRISGLSRSGIQSLIKSLQSKGVITWYIPGGIEQPSWKERSTGKRGVKRHGWIFLDLLSVSGVEESLDAQFFSDNTISMFMDRLKYWYGHYGKLNPRRGARSLLIRDILDVTRLINRQEHSTLSLAVLLRRCLRNIQNCGLSLAEVERVSNLVKVEVEKNLTRERAVDIIYLIFRSLHSERLSILGFPEDDLNKQDFLTIANGMWAIERLVGSNAAQRRAHFFIMRCIEKMINWGQVESREDLFQRQIDRALVETIKEVFGDVQVEPKWIDDIRSAFKLLIKDMVLLIDGFVRRVVSKDGAARGKKLVYRLGVDKHLRMHRIAVYTLGL